MPLCAIQAYVKQTLKTLVLIHPDLKKLFRKPIRKAVAAWVILEVRFLPERAGYKREHPKLAYSKTGKLTSNHIFFHIDYYCHSISCSVRLAVQSCFEFIVFRFLSLARNGHKKFLMLSLYVIGIRGAREAVAREERALARRQAAAERKQAAAGRGSRETHRSGCERVEAVVPVAGRMGVEDPTERDVPFVSGELVTEVGTAVVYSGEAVVVEAVVGSEEKEHVGVVDKGPSSLSGVERMEAVSITAAGAASGDIVRQVQQAQEAQKAADARIEARLIVAQARWEQQQRRRLPVLSAGTRQLQALGRDAEVEAFKAAVRWNRQQADRAAPSKRRRLEDMSSRGARMLRMVLEQRSEQS